MENLDIEIPFKRRKEKRTKKEDIKMTHLEFADNTVVFCDVD